MKKWAVDEMEAKRRAPQEEVTIYQSNDANIFGNIIRLTGAMLIGEPYGRNNARLRPAEFEESWPAPCLPTTDVLDSPSVPATASQEP
uniref:Uncharacterized protein n=1 Tax=Oryza nivara TaxID=4536 RepID=A0A0E0HUJ8_ORYNI